MLQYSTSSHFPEIPRKEGRKETRKEGKEAGRKEGREEGKENRRKGGNKYSMFKFFKKIM